MLMLKAMYKYPSFHLSPSICFLICGAIGFVHGGITFSNLPATVNIKQDVTTAANLLSVSATDTAGGTLSYTCAISPNDNKISSSCPSGVISYVNNPGFNALSTSVYTVTVTASSAPSTSTSVQATLTVNIISQSGPPTITNLPFAMNFAEGQLVGSFIYQVSATKPSASSSVLYYIENVYTTASSANFTITSDGKVKMGSLLDADGQATTEYVLLIKACDSFPVAQCNEANLTLTITEGNDPPVFTPSTVNITIPESTANGTTLEKVWAISDIDGDFIFVYGIQSPGNRYLTIDSSSGNLIVNEKLDYETFPSQPVSIVVSATDPHGLVGYVYVNFSLTDVNDCPATFTTTACTGNVTENEPLGTYVLSLNATDCDLTPDFQNFSYYVQSPYDSTYSIKKEADGTATVSLKRPLNREDISNFIGQTELRVYTQDSGGLTSFIFCLVTVGDVNEFEPLFELDVYRYFVRYDAIVGTVIDQLHAQDNDSSGRPLEYTVSNLTTVPEIFVGYYGGQVIVDGPLGSNKLYSLFVTATDQGNPPRSSKLVHVMVETFDPVLYLTDWTIDTGGVYLSKAMQEIIERNIDASCQSCSPRIAEVFQSPVISDHYVVSIYFVDGDTNTTNLLKLKTVSEVLAMYTIGDGQTPTAFASTLGPGYPIVRIQDKYTINWWLETPGGIFTTILLCLLGATGLVLLVVYLAKKFWWMQRPEKRHYQTRDDDKAPVVKNEVPKKRVAFDV